MLAKRIIPCLDVTDGRVVKGVNFVDLRDAGDPVECAKAYEQQGADELVFLDITASSDGRDTMLHIVERCAEQVFMPLTVGGGIRTAADVRRMLNAGADKVSFNTAAIHNPDLLDECSSSFGSQCTVLAIDARRKVDGGWQVFTHGGRNPTELDAVQWAMEGTERGAGALSGGGRHAELGRAHLALGGWHGPCAAGGSGRARGLAGGRRGGVGAVGPRSCQAGDQAHLGSEARRRERFVCPPPGPRGAARVRGDVPQPRARLLGYGGAADARAGARCRQATRGWRRWGGLRIITAVIVRHLTAVDSRR